MEEKDPQLSDNVCEFVCIPSGNTLDDTTIRSGCLLVVVVRRFKPLNSINMNH